MPKFILSGAEIKRKSKVKAYTISAVKKCREKNIKLNDRARLHITNKAVAKFTIKNERNYSAVYHLVKRTWVKELKKIAAAAAAASAAESESAVAPSSSSEVETEVQAELQVESVPSAASSVSSDVESDAELSPDDVTDDWQSNYERLKALCHFFDSKRKSEAKRTRPMSYRMACMELQKTTEFCEDPNQFDKIMARNRAAKEQRQWEIRSRRGRMRRTYHPIKKRSK